jgi:hypothetical protein
MTVLGRVSQLRPRTASVCRVGLYTGIARNHISAARLTTISQMP